MRSLTCRGPFDRRTVRYVCVRAQMCLWLCVCVHAQVCLCVVHSCVRACSISGMFVSRSNQLTTHPAGVVSVSLYYGLLFQWKRNTAASSNNRINYCDSELQVFQFCN